VTLSTAIESRRELSGLVTSSKRPIFRPDYQCLLRERDRRRIGSPENHVILPFFSGAHSGGPFRSPCIAQTSSFRPLYLYVFSFLP